MPARREQASRERQDEPNVELPESTHRACLRDAELQHRHRSTRTHDAGELAERRGRVVDVAQQVGDGQGVERCVGERQRLGSSLVQLDPRGEPAGSDASARDGEHVGAPVDADDRAAVLPDELERDRARAGGDVQHACVRSEIEPRDQEPTPAWVLAEREKPRIAVVRGAERREEGRRDAAARLRRHGIVSTILPSCSPASSRSCAARISESGNVESTCTRARPVRTSP